MKKINLAGAAALLVALAMPLAAQQTPQQPQPPQRPGMDRGPGMGREGMPRMLNVEMALRMKEQLKLNDSQASQLEALRKEIVADRQNKVRDLIDIKSRVEAGLLKREDVRKQFEGQRDAMRQTMESRQDRIAKILTPEQQDQLQRATRRMMMQRMRGRMGPGRGMGGMQGRGFQGRGFRGRGFRGRGGMMGRGFGPGFGDQFGPMAPRPPRPPHGPGFDEQQ